MPTFFKLRLHKLLSGKNMTGMIRFREFSESQSAQRAKLGLDVQTRDVFATLLEARDSESGDQFRPEELVSEAGLLIVAGACLTL